MKGVEGDVEVATNRLGVGLRAYFSLLVTCLLRGSARVGPSHCPRGGDFGPSRWNTPVGAGPNPPPLLLCKRPVRRRLRPAAVLVIFESLEIFSIRSALFMGLPPEETVHGKGGDSGVNTTRSVECQGVFQA